MPSEIKLPELGENLEGGEVLDVKVAEGDTVSVGQALLEVEAEKSTVEVPAPEAGRVAKLMVKKGDKIKVGQTLCLIENAGKEKSRPTLQKPAKQPTDKSEKAAAEKKTEGNGKREKPTGATAPAVAPTTGDSQRAVPAGPATRRLARELGVDLRRVTGTAPGGRVTPEDVKAYVRSLTAAPAGVGPGRPAAPPLPDFAKWGPIETAAIDPVRRRTSEQMALAWAVIPHVTQHDEADITDLDGFRREQDKGGPKLTVTAFALKACAVALKEFPAFNASLDIASGQIIYKRYYHIGVAVDTERGLLVPVLRDVDRKSIRDLGQELAGAAERARQRKLAVEEMRGGTFTITNLGGIGGTEFTPIINYPEVAILGLARARQQAVVRDGQVVPRLMLPLSLSYDHRIIDGADGARFIRRLAEMFENPLLMLL